MSKFTLTPKENLFKLKLNSYPGSGLILGVDQTGENAVQIYWIMGRDPISRNLVFSLDGDRLFTEGADSAKVNKSSPISYNAMDRRNKLFIVSNGNQTDTVSDECEEDYWTPLSIVLNETVYEPDAPNFTPRITGTSVVDDGKCLTELALIRKSDFAVGDDDCVRFYFVYESVRDGVGFCLTTYTGDGDPLPSFVGEPLAMPLEGNAETILSTYWDALNPHNRVSLAVRIINLKTGKVETLIRNRFAKLF